MEMYVFNLTSFLQRVGFFVEIRYDDGSSVQLCSRCFSVSYVKYNAPAFVCCSCHHIHQNLVTRYCTSGFTSGTFQLNSLLENPSIGEMFRNFFVACPKGCRDRFTAVCVILCGRVRVCDRVECCTVWVCVRCVLREGCGWRTGKGKGNFISNID
jgi:hypothetical protein